MPDRTETGPAGDRELHQPVAAPGPGPAIPKAGSAVADTQRGGTKPNPIAPHRWLKSPRTARARRPGKNRLRPSLERLEPHVLLTTFYVTNTGGSGVGSLSAAISAVNSDSGGTPDAIEPSAPVLNRMIYLNSPLPAITRSNVALQSLDVNGMRGG